MLYLLEAINRINVSRLLVDQFRCVVEQECFFLQRVHVVRREVIAAHYDFFVYIK